MRYPCGPEDMAMIGRLRVTGERTVEPRAAEGEDATGLCGQPVARSPELMATTGCPGGAFPANRASPKA